MRRIVACREMKELDRRTIEEMGVPSCVLMERAALKTVEVMEAFFEREKSEQRILCVCGSGNNGGDGVAIARIFFLHGYRAEIFLAGKQEKFTEETARQFHIAQKYHVPVVMNPDWSEYTTIVDAVFGVGLVRPVEGRYAQLIRQLNECSAWKVAVDIPSGVDGDTGMELGTAFRADLTVTFGYRKAGLCLYPGRMLAGRTVTADIGIYGDPEDPGNLRHIEETDLKTLPQRRPDGNKGTFGKVLTVAGNPGMCGAAYLCGASAFAAGAGMVRIFTAEENRIPLQTLLPEAIITTDGSEEAGEKAYQWSDVLILGPGLGTDSNARKKAEWFLRRAWEDRKPVILDADGLNLLSDNPQWRKWLGIHVTLTPHIGEMSRLTGKTAQEIISDRVNSAVSLTRETGAVCVLKDACTVTAGPEGNAWINLSGNAGMGTAGSGDVLAGVLAGMRCMYAGSGDEEADPARAAAMGVFVHGRAGDWAAEKKGIYGMKAGDLIPEISFVLQDGGNHEKV